MKKKSVFIIAVVAVLAIMIINSGMVVTYPNEYTVIKQFGRIESIRQ